MSQFTIYPAIDLRNGEVVRLKQGDPARSTTYASDPRKAAKRWREAGARWLHVINLDGAFGEADEANMLALKAIVACDLLVQFGGGLRTMEQIERAFELGAARAILGTVALEQPGILRQAIARFGERIIVAIDARQGHVRSRGWTTNAALDPLEFGKHLKAEGVSTVIFTDISRDGMQEGLNLELTVKLARETGLDVIASGGVSSLEDVRLVRRASLAGIVIGRALYEGQVSLEEALLC